MKKILFSLWILHLILFALILVLLSLEWNAFYLYVFLISAALFTVANRLWRMRQELREKAGRERWFHCIKNVGAALFILAVNLLLAYSSAERSPSPAGFYSSKDGRHELVVMEYTSLGVAYSAAPSMYHILYKDQDKDFVISPNDMPASDVQVQWLDDGSARVYIIYDPEVGPVEEDSILVSFAEQ